MSIIESHLFSQFVLWGISETAASMIMTIYGIMTMLGAIGTGLLGISGDSTVPPTTGLITREFGSEKLTILYGFAMMAHQVGALASASFGGICRDQWGTYVPLWIADMIITAIAAAASYSVKECPVSER